MNPLLEFGYVSKAHGLDGEVVVRTYDPASEVLDVVDRVHVKRRAGPEGDLTIAAVREGPGGDLLVTFEGIKSRPAAQALVGGKLFAHRDDLGETEAGEYFQGDLVGLEAFDEKGARVGVVEEVWNSGPVPNLVIRGGGAELILPFVDDFVPEVDVEKKRVVVRPPEEHE